MSGVVVEVVAAGTTAGGQAAVSAGSGTEDAAWVLVAKASDPSSRGKALALVPRHEC